MTGGWRERAVAWPVAVGVIVLLVVMAVAGFRW